MISVFSVQNLSSESFEFLYLIFIMMKKNFFYMMAQFIKRYKEIPKVFFSKC